MNSLDVSMAGWLARNRTISRVYLHQLGVLLFVRVASWLSIHRKLGYNTPLYDMERE